MPLCLGCNMAGKSTPIPVYVVTGFLDSGKSTFIEGILEDGFAKRDRTLYIRCEQGEAEVKPRPLVTCLEVDEPEQLTPDFLRTALGKNRQVLVEYNGMWPLQTLSDALPENWVLYQIVFTAHAPTFALYVKNMGTLMMEKLKSADMMILNRCNESLRASLRKRNLRLVNPQADIFLENEDGTNEAYNDGTVSAFDLSGELLTVTDGEYGLFCVEILNDPRPFLGKQVRFRAQMCKPPQYGDYFTPGRFAMVCCENDMTFLALPCIGYDVSGIPEKTWIEITATVAIEFFAPFEGDGPVLHVSRITPCDAPREEVVQI